MNEKFEAFFNMSFFCVYSDIVERYSTNPRLVQKMMLTYFNIFISSLTEKAKADTMLCMVGNLSFMERRKKHFRELIKITKKYASLNDIDKPVTTQDIFDSLGWND